MTPYSIKKIQKVVSELKVLFFTNQFHVSCETVIIGMESISIGKWRRLLNSDFCNTSPFWLSIIIIIDYRKGSVLHLVLEKSLRNMSCWQYIIHTGTCYVIDKNVIILLSNLDSCLGKKLYQKLFLFHIYMVNCSPCYLVPSLVMGKDNSYCPITVCLIHNKGSPNQNTLLRMHCIL